MQADVLAALLAHIETLTTASVYAGVLPERENADPKQPAAAVVIRPAGGGSAEAHLPTIAQRIDLFFYAPTMAEADVVRRVVYSGLRSLSHLRVGGVLLYSCLPAGGFAALRDPDTDWPVLFQSWTINAAEAAA